MHRFTVKIEAPRKPDEKSYNRDTIFSFDMESDLPLQQLQYITQQFATALTTAAYSESLSTPSAK